MLKSSSEFKNLTDRELVSIIKDQNTSSWDYNCASAAILDRYDALIHKMYWKFLQQTEDSPSAKELEDDFYVRGQAAIMDAIKMVKLSEIKNDNWKLIGYARYLVSNLKNDMIEELIEEGKLYSFSTTHAYENEEGDIVIDPEVEQAGWEQSKNVIGTEEQFNLMRIRQEIEDFRKTLTEEQNRIIDYKLASMTASEIGNQMGVTAKHIYHELGLVKTKFKQYKEENDLSYEDIM